MNYWRYYIPYYIQLGIGTVLSVLMMVLFYTIKVIIGLSFLPLYPLQLLQYGLTQKKEHWDKGMYIPIGIKIMFTKITIE